jgi:hypothetical protein
MLRVEAASAALVFGVNVGFAEPRPLATAVARIATTVLTGVVTLTDYETPFD